MYVQVVVCFPQRVLQLFQELRSHRVVFFCTRQRDSSASIFDLVPYLLVAWVIT
jgi:hypothetical protein